MTLHEVIDYAVVPGQAGSDSGEPAALSTPAQGTRLSPRENEVAALIAGGLSNRQIADRLVIAERTVTSHVEHILNKLSFHSRTQVAAWATEQRLRTGSE